MDKKVLLQWVRTFYMVLVVNLDKVLITPPIVIDVENESHWRNLWTQGKHDLGSLGQENIVTGVLPKRERFRDTDMGFHVNISIGYVRKRIRVKWGNLERVPI